MHSKISEGLLTKLSVVIPTYERQRFALRNMSYWSGYNVQVYVMDGSSAAIPKKHIALLGNNIHYYHAPIPMVQRIALARELVATPYVTLLGDDEFHLPSGLIASIQHLESHPGFVACMGRPVRFQKTHQGISFSLAYPEMRGYQLTESTPHARMIQHMRNYTPSTIYSVVRSWVWKRAWEPYLRHEFPVYAIGEIQFELSLAFYGKSEVLPVLHWLRSGENSSAGSRDVSLDPTKRFLSWWEDEKNEADKSLLVNITTEALTEPTDYEQEQVSSWVVQALDEYAFFVSQCAQPTNFRQKLHKFVSNKLSDKHKTVLRPLIRRFKRNRAVHSPGFTIFDYEKVLAGDGVRFDHGELTEVIQTITNFHQSTDGI